MKNIQILGLALTLLFTACEGTQKQKQFNADEHIANVKHLDSIYAHHIASKSLDSLENIFLNDAVVLPEGEAEIKGITAIKEWYANAFEFGLKSMVDSTTSITGDENNIVEIGKTTVGIMFGESDTITYESHKYLQVWHKQANGKYKISRQIWNN